MDVSNVAEALEIDNMTSQELKKLSAVKGLTEDFIDQYQDKLNWREIFRVQSLSDDFILSHLKNVQSDNPFFYKNVPDSLLDKIIQEYPKFKISWAHLSSQRHTENFIRKYQDKIDFTRQASLDVISIDLLKDFICKVDWEHVSSSSTPTDDFLVAFAPYLNWKILLIHPLSQRVLENCYKYFDKKLLIKKQKLSENLIEKYVDKDFSWDDVSHFQRISEKFILKHKNEVNWKKILKHQKLSDAFIHNLISKALNIE